MDNKQYNIAEVPLKDMFCSANVKDKPRKKGVSKNYYEILNKK